MFYETLTWKSEKELLILILADKNVVCVRAALVAIRHESCLSVRDRQKRDHISLWLIIKSLV